MKKLFFVLLILAIAVCAEEVQNESQESLEDILLQFKWPKWCKKFWEGVKKVKAKLKEMKLWDSIITFLQNLGKRKAGEVCEKIGSRKECEQIVDDIAENLKK